MASGSYSEIRNVAPATYQQVAELNADVLTMPKKIIVFAITCSTTRTIGMFSMSKGLVTAIVSAATVAILLSGCDSFNSGAAKVDVVEVETLIGKNLDSANRILGQIDGPRRGAPGIYLYEISAGFNGGNPVNRDFDDRPQDWIIVGACGRIGNDVSLGLVDRTIATSSVLAAARKNEYAGVRFECPGKRQNTVTVTR